MRFFISVAVVILIASHGWCQKDGWEQLYKGKSVQVLIKSDKIVRLNAETWKDYVPFSGKHIDSLTFWIKMIPLPEKHQEWLKRCSSVTVDYMLLQFAVDYKRNKIRTLAVLPYDDKGNMIESNSKGEKIDFSSGEDRFWHSIVPESSDDQIATAVKKYAEK